LREECRPKKETPCSSFGKEEQGVTGDAMGQTLSLCSTKRRDAQILKSSLTSAVLLLRDRAPSCISGNDANRLLRLAELLEASIAPTLKCLAASYPRPEVVPAENNVDVDESRTAEVQA